MGKNAQNEAVKPRNNGEKCVKGRLGGEIRLSACFYLIKLVFDIFYIIFTFGIDFFR